MRPPKINDRRLLALIDKGLSQSKAAKQLGVSRQAVNKRFLELRGKTTKAIVAKDAKRAVEQGFDAIDQLTAINQKSLDLLDKAEKDPQFALKCIAELRNQVRLAMDIQQNLYSQQAAQEFMATIVDIMREVDSGVYKKFIERINNEKSIRDALRFA